MTNFKIREAKRKGIFGRVALMGPAGAGKSLTSLYLAKGMTRNGKVLAIDTERGSLDNYADAVEGLRFDKIELETFSPELYVECILEGEARGYDTIVVDSLSHAWAGTGGALEIKDNLDRRGGNSYTNWRDVTPMHNKLVDTLLSVKAHTIVTMRSKMDYVLEENEQGKKVPRRVGLAPVQRNDMEYELSLVADLNQNHELIVTKSRYRSIPDNVVIKNPGVKLGQQIREWLDGNDPEPPTQEEKITELITIMKRKKLSLEDLKGAGFEQNPREVDQETLDKIRAWVKEK